MKKGFSQTSEVWLKPFDFCSIFHPAKAGRYSKIRNGKKSF
jgi:hypothetical protein